MTRELSKSEAIRWGELLESAVSTLGDAERAAYEKRVARLEGRFADENKPDVIRFLLEYAKMDGKFGECMRKCGLPKIELVTALSKVPDCHLVYAFVHDRRSEASELENEDILAEARESLKALVKEPGCEINVKAVTFAMERLDRKNFGGARSGEGDGGRAQVVYNIPNLSMNLIVAPGELPVVAKRGGEVVDAEVVPAKVEVKL